MNRKIFPRFTVSLMLMLCMLFMLAQSVFASSYTWTHQEYQNVMVQQGYWTQETYISGYHTETRQVGTGYRNETYVVQNGYWTTESYISGYYTETYQSGSHSVWGITNPGYWSSYSSWEVTSPGHYETTQTWGVVSPGYWDYTSYGWCTGYDSYGNYYSHSPPCDYDYHYGDVSSGTWVPPVYGWVTSYSWVPDQYGWVTHYYWVGDQYGWVSVPDYSTRQVAVWSSRSVWVAPVYGTRTVAYPIYQDFQVADYATRNVYVQPVYQWKWVTVNTTLSTPTASYTFSPAGTPKDTDKMSFTVSQSDPQGYPISGQQWTIKGPDGTNVTQSTPPTQLKWPGVWQVTLQVQSKLPDGQLSPWSDPYTQNITVIPEQIAQILGVKLTNVVKPPLWVKLPIDMPMATPIQIKSGYNVTLHVASKGAGTFKTELFSGGGAIPIGQDTTKEASFLTTAIPDGGGDITFFVPTSVANGSTIDVKLTEQVTDGAGYQTSSVFSMPTSFVISGSALDDTVVNRTK